MQGLLELADAAYVGSGVLGSALAMDKAMAKQVLAANGIPQARVPGAPRARDHPGLPAQLADELGLPCFVKPSNMGSSVGVTKAHDVEELRDAIEYALTYDEWVVVEEAIVGREIEVAVLGGADPVASGAGEIVPGEEFYSYEDKYVTDGAQLLVPAPLSAADTEPRARARRRRVPGAALRRAGPRRLLLRGGRARLPVQRGQHDARVHADLDVPEAVAGGRRVRIRSSSTGSSSWRSSASRGAGATPSTEPRYRRGRMATTATSATLPLGSQAPRLHAARRRPAPIWTLERARRSAWHARRLRLQPLPVRQARRRRLRRGGAALDRRRASASWRSTATTPSSIPRTVPSGWSSRRRRWGWSFPYLVDADQTAALAYGAVCTPDFFLFDGDRRARLPRPVRRVDAGQRRPAHR